MDMAFVARELLDEMRTLHPGQTFTLEISGDTNGEWDKPRIGQVLSNLLGNAVLYGFQDLPIGVTIKGSPKEIALSVHNEGVPIAKEDIRGIFDALVRADSGEHEYAHSTSLGLGLYITKEIVTAHGGAVQVTSSEKHGTTFTARFPRTPGDDLAAQGATTRHDHAAQKAAS
jgi:hypothetical protein